MTLRQKARTLFPQWTRRMRAKWVVAAAKAPGCRVPISAGVPHDTRLYWFARVS